MKALRKLTSDAEVLELVDVAKPTVSPGHVLIKVKAAGICGTDLHILKNEYPCRAPVTLGHEVSGEIAEMGTGVTGWTIGDRVVPESFYSVCGCCENCRGGRPNLCSKRLSIGSGVDGGFAEYVEVPATGLHRIPDGLDWADAALTEPLGCVINHIDKINIKPREWVVISGPGPMGLLTLQVARAANARVIVVGINQDALRLEAAKELGAEVVFNIEALGYQTVVDQIIQLTEGGAPVVLECAGAAPSAKLLLDVVRKQGRFGQIGLYGKSVTIDLDMICYKELTMIGSLATVPAVWDRAIDLLGSRLVSGKHVISGVWDLESWEEAFKRIYEKGALKIMLSTRESS